MGPRYLQTLPYITSTEHTSFRSPGDWNASTIFKALFGFQRKLVDYYTVTLFVLNSISLFTKAELCGLQLTGLFEELGRTHHEVHISVIVIICSAIPRCTQYFVRR